MNLDFTATGFYVYIYMDTRKSGVFKYGKMRFSFEPFYVGMGTRGRFLNGMLVNWTQKDKGSIVRKIVKNTGKLPTCRIVAKYLTRSEARVLESNTIKLIGRRNSGEGPLINKVGGIGGRTHLSMSQIKATQSAVKKRFSITSTQRLSELCTAEATKYGVSVQTIRNAWRPVLSTVKNNCPPSMNYVRFIKLSKIDKHAIKLRYTPYKHGLAAQLAEEFNVSVHTIKSIWHR